VTVDPFRRDNHYVSRNYLKRWTSDGVKLWSYRVLVSHADVPLWRRTSTRGIAYHEHLYTKIAASGESDEVERWLGVEFEAPAEEAIEKVVSDKRLTPPDWRLLARFFASQDVRTPARLIENMQRWSASLSETVQESMRNSVARLEAMSEEELRALSKESAPVDQLPFRAIIEKNPGGPGGWIKGSTIVGRGLWIWSIRHVLSSTLRALYKHRWTILHPPRGMTWFTSDDPVLEVNFNSLKDYTFGGGWGSTGTDLLLPLSPDHLLFTQVGKPVPKRGTRMDVAKATVARRLIAEHAHRHIFARDPDAFVEQIRPRTIDDRALRREGEQWRQWHAEQTAAERELMGYSDSSVDPAT
jgi:hypothetical protein